MVDFNLNWDAMNAEEQTLWLSSHILGSPQHFPLGEDAQSLQLIDKCQKQIGGTDKCRLWLENVISEVSAHVYNGMTDEQVQHEATLWAYYQYLHTAPTAVRGRALHYAARGLKV